MGSRWGFARANSSSSTSSGDRRSSARAADAWPISSSASCASGGGFILPKYDPARLQAVLEEVLGDRRVGDAKTRLLVPAWNPVARSVYIYKTAHHQRFRTDYQSFAVDAAMATAAAPTYFRRHVSRHSAGLTDGGTWANNPTALAVVEGICDARLAARHASRPQPRLSRRDVHHSRTGGDRDARLQAHQALHGRAVPPARWASQKLLTGHEHERNAIHRIDHCVPSGSFKMDDAGVIQELKGLGHSLARDRYPVLESVFFHAPAGAFSPVYPLGAFP